ncbi:MAG: acyl-CoA thioesterase [Treponema sp.]|nr:acyl-CoA thioesterase [Treponema sp.]
MDRKTLTEEIVFPVEFYDVDSMMIVWHGNYVKYMEKARCALLDKIGFGYLDMAKSGFSFPIVDVRVKYVKSLRFGDRVRAVASLTEYEACIKIKFEFYNAGSGELTTKAESTQMAVSEQTGESCFITPATFREKVETLMEAEP